MFDKLVSAISFADTYNCGMKYCNASERGAGDLNFRMNLPDIERLSSLVEYVIGAERKAQRRP